MKKRAFLKTAALKTVVLKSIALKTTLALLFATTLTAAHAQMTPIKFQLDWRFEGPAALFLTPAAKGYFKDAKLDVVIDAGNGSGGTPSRAWPRVPTTWALPTWPR